MLEKFSTLYILQQRITVLSACTDGYPRWNQDKKGPNRSLSAFFFLSFISKGPLPDWTWWQLFGAPWGRTRAKPRIFKKWKRDENPQAIAGQLAAEEQLYVHQNDMSLLNYMCFQMWINQLKFSWSFSVLNMLPLFIIALKMREVNNACVFALSNRLSCICWLSWELTMGHPLNIVMCSVVFIWFVLTQYSIVPTRWDANLPLSKRGTKRSWSTLMVREHQQDADGSSSGVVQQWETEEGGGVCGVSRGKMRRRGVSHLLRGCGACRTRESHCAKFPALCLV